MNTQEIKMNYQASKMNSKETKMNYQETMTRTQETKTNTHATSDFIDIKTTTDADRPKMPYGHGRGDISEETEVRKEYYPKHASRSPQVKHPDNINFGKNGQYNTDYRDNYYPKNGETAKLDFDKTQELKKKITVNATRDQILQFKKEHALKYIRSSVDNERVAQPTAWFKGKIEKKDLEFDGQTTHRLHYQAPVGEPNKPFATYNNLKITSEIANNGKSSYERTFVRREMTHSVDKELYSHNYTKGKAGHLFLKNPSWKKNTSYHNHFNETLKVGDIRDKPYYGKDDKMRDLLRQHDKGYFYTD